MLAQRISACLAALMFVLCVRSHAAEADTPKEPDFRVCLPDLEVAPYLRTANNKGTGLFVELVREAAQSVGMNLKISHAPSKRCQAHFEQGNVDGLVGAWNDTTRRLGRFPMKGGAPDPQRRLARIPMVWIQRKANPLVWSGSRFFMPSGHLAEIGVLRNMVILAEPLRAQGYHVEDNSMSAKQLLEQLQAHRIDAAVCVADQILREFDQGFDELEILSRTLTQVDYYLIVTPRILAKSPWRVEAFWNAIGRARGARPQAKPSGPISSRRTQSNRPRHGVAR